MTAPTHATTVPDALTALVAAFRTVPGIDVTDGPPVSSVGQDFVAVGFTGDPSEDAVTFRFDEADAALGRAGESYDVACVLSSTRGDSTFAAVRPIVFGLFAQLRAAVAADRKLGGAVSLARVSGGSVIHDVAGKGAVVSIPFTVHVQAWSR